MPPGLTFSAKLTKPKRQRVSFPTKGSNVQRKSTTKSFLILTRPLTFCAKATPLEKDYNDFQNLVNSGLTTELSVANLRIDRIPPTGAENYWYLQGVWEKNNMQNFSDFLKFYTNKDVVPTLDAM